MCDDPCFLKLALWPANTVTQPVEGLVPGLYLPLSYVRMLLADDCTRGVRDGYNSRYLGYPQVERYLVGDQFVELVKHGLAGTVGTSVEQLRNPGQFQIGWGSSRDARGRTHTQIIPDGIGPGRGVQQPLHPQRAGLTGRLSQRPPVRSADRARLGVFVAHVNPPRGRIARPARQPTVPKIDKAPMIDSVDRSPEAEESP